MSAAPRRRRTPGARPRPDSPPRAARREARAPGAPAPDAPLAAPARALWIALALLVAARAALAFVPSMTVWGLNLGRFVTPLAGWPLWLVAAAALAPAVARRAAVAVADAGDLARRRPALASTVAALVAIALVLAFPDRVRYMGDFLLRQGSVMESVEPAKVFPQALPLDVLLHYRLPFALDRAGIASPNTTARLAGGLDAAILALVAWSFARTLALAGGAAAAAAAVVFFGGFLGMFTGYSKAVVELCLLAALCGTLALRAVRTGGGLAGLGAALAIAFALHRSALALVPFALLAWAMWLRAHGGGGAWRRPATLLAILVPLAALGMTLPKIIATFRDVDMAVHLAPAITQTEGGILRSAFGGTRTLDLASLVLMLSPLAVAIPFLSAAFGRALPRGRELLLLVTLALPFLAAIPFIHATNGLYRDWDNFAAAGTTLSLVAAWLVGETLRGTPRSWLAVAVVAGVAVPSVQWLAHHADVDRGLARMAAFMNEPPLRSGTDRATTWDFLGLRNYQLTRYAASAEAFAHAAETAPSPRILLQHGLALTQSGRIDLAQQAYRRMIEVVPNDPLAWRGLAAMSERLGDWEEAKRAATRLIELSPGDADGVGILRAYEQREAARRARGAP